MNPIKRIKNWLQRLIETHKRELQISEVYSNMDCSHTIAMISGNMLVEIRIMKFILFNSFLCLMFYLNGLIRNKESVPLLICVIIIPIILEILFSILYNKWGEKILKNIPHNIYEYTFRKFWFNRYKRPIENYQSFFSESQTKIKISNYQLLVLLDDVKKYKVDYEVLISNDIFNQNIGMIDNILLDTIEEKNIITLHIIKTT